jgi:hypothetical protein
MTECGEAEVPHPESVPAQAAAGLKSQVHSDLEPEIGERRVGGKR